jgi:LysR family hydrogen peroxide-inducible transcriptional activator
VRFERNSKSVRPTAAGERIVALARTLLEQAAAVREAAREPRDPMSGTLRLGVIPTVAPYLLPCLLGPLRRAYPALGLVLAEALTDTLLERLRNH